MRRCCTVELIAGSAPVVEVDAAVSVLIASPLRLSDAPDARGIEVVQAKDVDSEVVGRDEGSTSRERPRTEYDSLMDLAFFDRFPVLETERLQMRELLDEDAPALFEVLRDEEVTRYYDVDTMAGVAAAVEVIAEMRKRYVDRVGIRWALVEKGSASLVGTIGFNSINLSAHKCAIGYELARRVWGQGFATEAVRAAVRFGHDEIGLNRIEAAVMLGNEASVRVLHKAGFKEEGVLRALAYWKGSYHDLRVFSVLRNA